MECQNDVQVITGKVCDVCGLPQDGANLCLRCQRSRPAYKCLRSWSIFESPVREALHRLKYRRDVGLGEALSNQILNFVQQLGWPLDVLVPIPLGKRRHRERGYNQVAMFAKPLSMQLGLTYMPNALSRVKETRSQVGLSADERQKNVTGAFKADTEKVKSRAILLMDDVSTTGATLSSAAEALLSAGAREVYAVTVARALPHHGLQIV